MNTATFKSSAAKLKVLDLADHFADIDAAKQRRKDIQSAIARGEENAARLVSELNKAKSGETIDPDAAADAMLSGQTVALATKSIETIQVELDNNKAGLSRLRERDAEAVAEIARLTNAAVGAFAGCFHDLPAVLEAEARDALATLASIFAATAALANGTRNGVDLRDKLNRVLRSAHEVSLIREEPIPVPSEMKNFLSPAREAIAQLGLTWSDTAVFR